MSKKRNKKSRQQERKEAIQDGLLGAGTVLFVFGMIVHWIIFGY